MEEKDVNLAEETLRRILELIPVETTVRAEQSDGKIVLNIEGDRSGLLIGRKGQTLDAIQFIVNKIVGKALDKKINVVVDSENYRRRRAGVPDRDGPQDGGQGQKDQETRHHEPSQPPGEAHHPSGPQGR